LAGALGITRIKPHKAVGQRAPRSIGVGLAR
jgi:hypothetical protein